MEFDQDEVKKEFLENISRKQTGRMKIACIEDRIPQQKISGGEGANLYP